MNTITCPRWCRADHEQDAVRYPLDGTTVHRQVLAQAAVGLVEVAADEDDVTRLFVWLGGESLSVEASTPQQRRALADLFLFAGAALVEVDQ